MFLKLLKYKFNGFRNLFLILSAVALSLGIVGALDLWFLTDYSDKIENDVISAFSGLFGSMLLMVIWYSLIAYTIAMSILLVVQFYKSHFSDEGYLTFTLPVTTHQHLLSSYVSNLIWTVISGLVLLVSILIFASPTFALEDFGSLMDIMFDVYTPYMRSLILFAVLIGTTSFLSSSMIPLLAVSIGCVAAKKGKILASFGIYYGINSVISTVTYFTTIFSLIGDVYIWDTANFETFRMLLTTLVPSTIYLGVAVGGYFLMHRLVDKKLNLP